MLHNKKTFPLTLALLLSLGMYSAPSRASESRESIIAQATEETTKFPLVETIPEDSKVKISSSEKVESINNGLKDEFEAKYSGATVEVTSTDSDSALEALANQEVDLAAISRPLTEAEEAQGFKPVTINREKIAIIVSENNPYDGNLTTEQFAQIFRGEITDWSEVGGASQPIKVVDLTSNDDTRRSLPGYPVFKSAEFKTGSNATVVPDNSTTTVVEQLGTDGIGYLPVSAVEDLEGVKIVTMHQTLPDDERYPFSQPNLYVYQGEPSPAAQAFLGFATAEANQGIIANAIANLPEVELDTVTPETTTEVVPETTAEVTPETTTEVVPETTAEVAPETTTEVVPETTTEVAPETTTEVLPTETQQRQGSWWWYLPLALLIPLIAFLVKKGKETENASVGTLNSERELVGAGVRTAPTTSNLDDNGLGTAATTGLSAAAIAAARRRRQADLNTPNTPNMPDMPNVGGAVDGMKNRVNDMTSNINTPNMPNMPNVGGTVDGMKNRAGETFNNLGERINSNNPSNQNTDFLGKIRDKADELGNNIGDRASDIKDNLTGEGDRNI